MDGQTAIPTPDEEPPSGPCVWCGRDSVGTVEIEKARWHNHFGTRVMARRPIVAPACADHINILERQPEPSHADYQP